MVTCRPINKFILVSLILLLQHFWQVLVIRFFSQDRKSSRFLTALLFLIPALCLGATNVAITYFTPGLNEFQRTLFAIISVFGATAMSRAGLNAGVTELRESRNGSVIDPLPHLNKYLHKLRKTIERGISARDTAGKKTYTPLTLDQLNACYDVVQQTLSHKRIARTADLQPRALTA